MKKRNYSIDTLKFFCILGVICRHYVPFNGMDLGWPGSRYLGIVINTIARVCVPLFFMITGYFSYKKNDFKYTKCKVTNLSKILISWSIIYIIANFFMSINLKNSTTIADQFLHYIGTFRITDLYYATGIINYHLWYLSALIVAVIILYYIVKRKWLEKVVMVALILNIIGVFIPVFLKAESYIWVRDAMFFAIFYCMLGAYIHKYEYKLKQIIGKLHICVCISILIGLFGMSIVERFLYLWKFNSSGEYFVSTIPLAIFIFCVCLVHTSLLKNSIINKLGRHTLGIYLVHPLVLSIVTLLLTKLDIVWISNTVIWQIVYPLAVLIISVVIYSALQKIKELIWDLIFNKSNSSHRVRQLD